MLASFRESCHEQRAGICGEDARVRGRGALCLSRRHRCRGHCDVGDSGNHACKLPPLHNGWSRRATPCSCRFLFGEPMRPPERGYALRIIAKSCISKEFRVLAANESSPIVDWLRALARHAHAECGGRGVGAIGMCFTGNFALAMMLDAPVLAPVLSQPSLPFAITKSRRGGLHASAEELQAAHEKIDNQWRAHSGAAIHSGPDVPRRAICEIARRIRRRIRSDRDRREIRQSRDFPSRRTAC